MSPKMYVNSLSPIRTHTWQNTASTIMALFSDDTNGNKMINKLKKLWEVHRHERYRENLQHVVNSKTGITLEERARVLGFPEFVPGKTHFFLHQFSFCYCPSF